MEKGLPAEKFCALAKEDPILSIFKKGMSQDYKLSTCCELETYGDLRPKIYIALHRYIQALVCDASCMHGVRHAACTDMQTLHWEFVDTHDP